MHKDILNNNLFTLLSYFNDIDYLEQVEYIVTPVDENEIKSYLTDLAINF